MVTLLLVGVAPPYDATIRARACAKSATNDSADNLRGFLEQATSMRWDDLISKGVFFIHAVKCAVVPDEEGFQNPSTRVVDRCAGVGFMDEFRMLHPRRVVTLGGAPRRSVLRHPAVTPPHGVGVSKSLKELMATWPAGIPCRLGAHSFTLHPAPFPRSVRAKLEATPIIRNALRLAGLT
jgi:uracil-DNA glycosylase